jgi:hypothetical protein
MGGINMIMILRTTAAKLLRKNKKARKMIM